MRNLVLVNHFNLSFGGVFFPVLVEGETSVFGISESSFIVSLDIESGEVEKIFNFFATDPDSGEPYLKTDDEIIGLASVVELDGLCVASRKGKILVFSIETSCCEIIGEIEEGILSMGWSIDEETVVFVTGSHTVRIMTKDFEPVQECGLQVEDSSGGEKVTRASCISWSENGECFGVSVKNEVSSLFSVYSRDGEELSSGSGHPDPEVLFTSNVLSFAPNGSLFGVPTTTTKENNMKSKMVLFEKNGLYRDEFEFYPTKCEVTALDWNVESKFLCVGIKAKRKCPEGGENVNVNVIRIFTRRNYHWYQKQELLTTSPIKSLYWDRENELKLHVFTTAKYLQFEFTVDTFVQRGVSYVIDGKKLCLSVLKYSCIPPPMSTDTVEFPNPINYVYGDGGGVVFVMLSTGEVMRGDVDVNEKPPRFGLPMRNVRKVCQLRVDCNDNLRLLALLHDKIVSISTNKIFYDGRELSSSSSLPRPPCVVIGVCYFEKNCYFQTSEGAIFSFDGEEIMDLKLSFPQSCVKFNVFFNKLDSRISIVGLTDNGLLYVESDVLNTTCSSYYINSEFLFFTTFSNALSIISLSTNSVSMIATLEEGDVSRDVERGALLVCALENKVIVQQPRGNLETIYPKYLSFLNLVKLLERGEYGIGFEMCKRFKIDMNVLYDYNPGKFDPNVFFSKINNPSYFNMFLSNLVDHNSLIQYKFYKGKREEVPDKVKLLCGKFLDIFTISDKTKYLTCILTAFVKQDLLRNAMEYIRSLEEVVLVKSLKYLIFLVDVITLYHEALGLYDYSLALCVAKLSTIDPKEYIPFLNGLKSLSSSDEFLGRFKVDVYLKRYRSALENIKKSKSIIMEEDVVEEVMRIIVEEKMYLDALAIFKGHAGGRIYNEVLSRYAHFLNRNGEYGQSALCFLECEDFENAQDNFIECGDYQLAFSLARKLKKEKDDVDEIAERIIDTLKSQNRPLEVSIIYREYLQDDESSVSVLVDNYEFKEAIRVISMLNRDDLMEELVEGVESYHEDFVDDVKEKVKKMSKYVNRLKEIRREKEKSKDEMEQSPPPPPGSDTESVLSGISAYTGVTVVSISRGRKIAKKKRDRLKRGSPFEEENLQKRIMELVPSKLMQKQIKTLVETLVYLNKFKEVDELSKVFETLISIVMKNRDEIEKPFFPTIYEGEQFRERIEPEKLKEIMGDEVFAWKFKYCSI